MSFKLRYITTRVNIGIEKPFSFLHISDNHVALADERNDQRKIDLANNRVKYFANAEENVEQAREFAKENDTFIVSTGDLLDFTSEKNYEYAKALSDSCDIIMAAGNHEFSHYLGEAKEDTAYKMASLDRIQECFKNNILFSSRKVNGVNIITIDNSYHQMEKWQTERLKEEIKLGLPILVFMHTPLYQPDFYDLMINKLHHPCAFLMNVPDELVDLYPEGLHEHHLATADTREAYELMVNEPLIKAVFTGHIHVDFEADLNEGKKQYSTSCVTGRIIEIY